MYDAATNLYSGAVVFTMPSGDMGTWKLSVDVDGESVDFDVNVAATPANVKLVGTYVGTDDKRYTISLITPAKPKIGLNDLEILINQRESAESFPPADDLTVEFEPEMPSMNHGSPNNVNPVSIGNGRYKGKVNFTMTGDWRLHFTLKSKDKIVLEDAYLDILF